MFSLPMKTEAMGSGELEVFTDGACIGNPGPGGWAWAVDSECFASGAEPSTTNQRMELMAVLRALSVHQGKVRIKSDSIYVVKCFQDRWWARWRTRGWRNAQGQPVANRDLWEPLIEIVVDERPGSIEFAWVKGHGGDAMNEFVDQLANTAARAQRGSSSDTTRATGRQS